MIRFIIISLASLFSIHTNANPGCIKNGYDICKEAKELTQTMSKVLPNSFGGYYTYKSVSSFYNNIIVDAYLPHSKELYKDMFAKHPEDHAKIVDNIEYILKDVCKAKNRDDIFYGFISRGGKFTYIYKYPDNTRFHLVEIESCKNK